jgi:hypothetical protein
MNTLAIGHQATLLRNSASHYQFSLWKTLVSPCARLTTIQP